MHHAPYAIYLHVLSMTASRKTHVKVEISLNVFKRGESCGKASDCCTLITDVPAGTMRDVSLLLGTYLLGKYN